MRYIRNVLARIGEYLAILNSAAATAEAVRGHRQPAAADLIRLGIDPERFRRIGHV